MSAHCLCCVFQLLGTLRFVRRWVVIGRVLQRARGELWALTVLLLLLLMLCTHLGNMVQQEALKNRLFMKMFIRRCVWHSVCLRFSFSPGQWKASCPYVRPVCQCCPSCGAGELSKDCVKSTQSSGPSMLYSWWEEVSAYWPDSVEQFSFIHTGTIHNALSK